MTRTATRLALALLLPALLAACGGRDADELDRMLAAAEAAAVKAEAAQVRAERAAASLGNAQVLAEEPEPDPDEELVDDTQSEEFDNTIVSRPPPEPAAAMTFEAIPAAPAPAPA